MRTNKTLEGSSYCAIVYSKVEIDESSKTGEEDCSLCLTRVEQEDLSRKINFRTEIHISINKYMYIVLL